MRDRPLPAGAHHVFRLYVTGSTARSTRAIIRVKALCQQYLKGRYKLEVIDLYQQPHEGRNAQIVATPTLIREQPKPRLCLVGELSDPGRLAMRLGLRSKPN